MADILTFKRRAGSAPRPPRSGEPQAEIVIFPGVRYEYHDDQAPKSRRRQSARRDVLELVE